MGRIAGAIPAAAPARENARGLSAKPPRRQACGRAPGLAFPGESLMVDRLLMERPRIARESVPTPLAGDPSVRVRVSPRARRIAIHIDAAEGVVELVLPPRARPETGWA